MCCDNEAFNMNSQLYDNQKRYPCILCFRKLAPPRWTKLSRQMGVNGRDVQNRFFQFQFGFCSELVWFGSLQKNMVQFGYYT